MKVVIKKSELKNHFDKQRTCKFRVKTPSFKPKTFIFRNLNSVDSINTSSLIKC